MRVGVAHSNSQSRASVTLSASATFGASHTIATSMVAGCAAHTSRLSRSGPNATSRVAWQAFLVPYTIVLIVIGMPLFLLELYVGQKCQLAATKAWPKFSPAFSGLGIAGTLATFFVALYYNVIVAWALWFLFNSFADPLPWADSANMTAANVTGRGAVRCWPKPPAGRESSSTHTARGPVAHCVCSADLSPAGLGSSARASRDLLLDRSGSLIRF